jgi:hypothetical protein
MGNERNSGNKGPIDGIHENAAPLKGQKHHDEALSKGGK